MVVALAAMAFLGLVDGDSLPDSSLNLTGTQAIQVLGVSTLQPVLELPDQEGANQHFYLVVAAERVPWDLASPFVGPPFLAMDITQSRADLYDHATGAERIRLATFRGGDPEGYEALGLALVADLLAAMSISPVDVVALRLSVSSLHHSRIGSLEPPAGTEEEFKDIDGLQPLLDQMRATYGERGGLPIWVWASLIRITDWNAYTSCDGTLGTDALLACRGQYETAYFWATLCDVSADAPCRAMVERIGLAIGTKSGLQGMSPAAVELLASSHSEVVLPSTACGLCRCQDRHHGKTGGRGLGTT